MKKTEVDYRYNEVMDMLRNGETKTAIGTAFGITATAVLQLIRRSERRLKEKRMYLGKPKD